MCLNVKISVCVFYGNTFVQYKKKHNLIIVISNEEKYDGTGNNKNITNYLFVQHANKPVSRH